METNLVFVIKHHRVLNDFWLVFLCIHLKKKRGENPTVTGSDNPLTSLLKPFSDEVP